MKNGKIVFLLAILVLIFVFNIKSYAITLPWFSISSNNYSNRDKMTLDEKKEVEINKTLQLYGMLIYGNDIYNIEHPENTGIFVHETNLSGITWNSSNSSIATVDNTGKVTGIAKGKTTITATYNGESATYEITVMPNSDEKKPGIAFVSNSAEYAKLLNKECEFLVTIHDIPDTEKGNIKFTIENENIAKLTGVNLCNVEGNVVEGQIIANVKALALGKTKITASLNYNGSIYFSVQEFEVVESRYSLSLLANGIKELPSSLAVGEKLQLNVIIDAYPGIMRPAGIGLRGVTFTSSNENIATVDNKGLITAIGEGTATITVRFTEKDDTTSVNYELKIIDPTKSPSVGPEKASIAFARSEPEPAKILNKDYGFVLNLYNIPDTEKENIKFTIEDEKIAKLTGVNLCNAEGNIVKGQIVANTKLLALGKTKIIATLNYNGTTYSSTYDFDVIESAYSLSISSNEYTDLPANLNVGEKIQLTIKQYTYGGSLLPKDVTSNGATYESSDEKVVKIDKKGLVTAIGEGTATITVKYKVGDETISAKYELKIKDPTKTDIVTNPNTSESETKKRDTTIASSVLPQTGENSTIVAIAIIIIILISVIMYKKYKNYKNIK